MLFPLKSMAHDSYGIMQAWREGGYSDDLIVAAKCAEHELKIVCPSSAVFPQRCLGPLCMSSKGPPLLPPLPTPPPPRALPALTHYSCRTFGVPPLPPAFPHTMRALAHLRNLLFFPLGPPSNLCMTCPPFPTPALLQGAVPNLNPHCMPLYAFHDDLMSSLIFFEERKGKTERNSFTDSDPKPYPKPNPRPSPERLCRHAG